MNGLVSAFADISLVNKYEKIRLNEINCESALGSDRMQQ